METEGNRMEVGLIAFSTFVPLAVDLADEEGRRLIDPGALELTTKSVDQFLRVELAELASGEGVGGIDQGQEAQFGVWVGGQEPQDGGAGVYATEATTFRAGEGPASFAWPTPFKDAGYRFGLGAMCLVQEVDAVGPFLPCRGKGFEAAQQSATLVGPRSDKLANIKLPRN